VKRQNSRDKSDATARDPTATVIDLAAAGRTGAAVNGPGDPRDWDAISWHGQELQVRRLRQRIFKAAQAGDLKRVRNLQRLTAPRGALSYPRFSREELEGRFLGPMAYLDPKG